MINGLYKSKILDFEVEYSNKAEFNNLRREIFDNQIYRIDSNQEDIKVIIDIGSHIGLSLLYFYNLFPNAKIYACEPNLISYEILRQNLKRNYLDKIISINNLAVSKSSGKSKLYIDQSDNHWFSSSSLLKNGWNGKQDSFSIEVESIALERLIEEYYEKYKEISLIKIDVEGYESRIFESIRKDSLKMVNNFLIEFHPQRGISLDSFTNSFKRVGFKLEVRDSYDDNDVLKVLYFYK